MKRQRTVPCLPDSFVKTFNLKKALSKDSIKKLFYCVLAGLIIMALLGGKTERHLETIAISLNEEYIAYYEILGGSHISCFHADGTLAFKSDILSEISAGGSCALWFEDNILCASFYRTDITVRYAMDGTILSTTSKDIASVLPKFSSFSKKGQKYVFDGNSIDVVYDRSSIWEYWFLNAERSLTIASKNGESKVIWLVKAE